MANINFENAQLRYRNFEGRKDVFNEAGKRNFWIALDQEQAEDLESQGFNIRWPKENPDIDPMEDTRQPMIKVNVLFNQYGPKIVQVREMPNGQFEKRVEYTEDIAQLLDVARMSNVDISTRSFEYDDTQHKQSLYLQEMYFEMDAGGFENKYGF